MLPAAWLVEYGELSADFARWQQLSAEIHERIVANIPTLQAANDALPENLVPLTNYKLINAIQLKRVTGEAWTIQEYSALEALAFACPLEAGNAVYRARSILSTLGDYVFDDSASCGLDKEEVIKKHKPSGMDTSISKSEWQIYPNPAKHQLWIAGSQMEDLQSVQLIDGLGRTLFEKLSEGEVRLTLSLPTQLAQGIYFLHLRLHSGDIETRKILIQP